MCQISSLMAAAEGLVAEFSSFANSEEKERKSNLLMPFPKIANQMGSFDQIRKNSLFRFCRPILDIYGFTLLTDKDYTELISQKIPEFASKYREVTDKGLLWEMIKMEIRAATILFSKRKARQKRDEDKTLLEKFNRLQDQIRANFNELTKAEIDRVKNKLAKIVAKKSQGTIVRSRTRWYEFGEKNNKYFLNLEERNHRKKHITSLKKEDGSVQLNAKQILEEEENFF